MCIRDRPETPRGWLSRFGGLLLVVRRRPKALSHGPRSLVSTESVACRADLARASEVANGLDAVANQAG
eukprot:5156769-Alexandrium_andersonii.AAC.1